MALPWVRLDTQWPSNPKFLALIDAKKHRAIVLYMAGLGYSGAHSTDGFVPHSALRILHSSKSEALDLVMARLWHCTEGGYGINDWNEYQETSHERMDRFTRQKKASAKANCVRWHGEDCGCWKTVK